MADFLMNFGGPPGPGLTPADQAAIGAIRDQTQALADHVDETAASLDAALIDGNEPAGVVAAVATTTIGDNFKAFASFMDAKAADVATATDIVIGRHYSGVKLRVQVGTGAVSVAMQLIKRSITSGLPDQNVGTAIDTFLDTTTLSLADAGLAAGGSAVDVVFDIDLNPEAGFAYGWLLTALDASNARVPIAVGRVAAADAGLAGRKRGAATTSAVNNPAILGSGAQQLAVTFLADTTFNAKDNKATVDQLRSDVDALQEGAGGDDPGVSRLALAVGIMGQSTEAGAVNDADRAAWPQAFTSIRRPGRAVPFAPNVGASGRGGWGPKLIDDLWDWGYDLQLLNGAIGSQSFMRHACGYIPALARNTAYYERRYPLNGKDAGYYGDLVVDTVTNRVLRCVVGNDIAAWHDGGPFGWVEGRTPNLDYIDQTSGKASAAAAPDFSAVALNGTVVDGTVTWQYVGTLGSGVYAGLGVNGVLTEAQKGFGFDPFGTLQRLASALSATKAARKIVYIANGQADAGIGQTLYAAALVSIGNFYLARGFEIMIGLTQFTATAKVADYNGLANGRSTALTTLKADATFGSRVHDGANLYASMGTTGPMGGAKFTGSIASGVLTVSAVDANVPGALEVGQRIVDPTAGTVLGTVASLGTGTGGAGTYNLTGGVDTASQSMRGSGAWYQITPADLNIHITGAGMVGPDVGGVSCAAKYVADAFKAFLPEIAV